MADLVCHRERSTRRIAALDGLRALSVIAVLSTHAWLTIPDDLGIFRRLLGYLPSAELGVHVFFVLSGYLITSLLSRELSASGRIDVPAFYVRRVRRIFPVFYAYIIALAALTAAGVLAISGVHFASAGSFLWNYKNFWDTSPGHGVWFLGHFWTLALEEQFYLGWPLLVALGGLARARRTALVVIAVLPLVRVLTYFTFPAMRQQMAMMAHTAIDTIMTGCLLALDERAPRLERPALVAVAILTMLKLDPALERAWGGAYRFTIGIAVRAASIAVLVQWIVARPASLLARLLAWPPLVRIGLMSYSLYVWQQLALTPDTPRWCGGFPLNLLVAFVLGAASWRWLERPFLAPRREPEAADQGA